MKKTIILLCLSAVLAGCAGRTANPISAKQVGDRELTCPEIEGEMEDLDKRAKRLLAEQSAKTGKNVAWGVAGLIFLPLLLGMDLSDAERQEAQAMQDRHSYLSRLARKKDCDIF